MTGKRTGTGTGTSTRTCKKAAYWLQLYLDGRLDPSRLARLEQHLRACDTCREDCLMLEHISACACERELVAEPPDLTERILARVASYEAGRAGSAEEWLTGVPRWALSWRSIAVALVVVLGLAFLVEPATLLGALTHLSSSLAGQVSSAYGLLLAPGPDSISWGIWAMGIAAALVLAVWFARADGPSSLRRAIAERLPQLW